MRRHASGVHPLYPARLNDLYAHARGLALSAHARLLPLSSRMLMRVEHVMHAMPQYVHMLMHARRHTQHDARASRAHTYT
jgi:hypothetical protein